MIYLFYTKTVLANSIWVRPLQFKTPRPPLGKLSVHQQSDLD